MLTKMDIQALIQECRKEGEKGLGNGSKGLIDDLILDFIRPPSDFLGVRGNPAIFVNPRTYHLLGRHHVSWIANKTIAVKMDFLANPPMMVIGALVHEVGHAFNIAAEVENSEANAYIFEIEVLMALFKKQSVVLSDCSASDLLSYFKTRLPYYSQEWAHPYLTNLMMKLEQFLKFLTGEMPICTPSHL